MRLKYGPHQTFHMRRETSLTQVASATKSKDYVEKYQAEQNTFSWSITAVAEVYMMELRCNEVTLSY